MLVAWYNINMPFIWDYDIEKLKKDQKRQAVDFRENDQLRSGQR